MDMEKNTKLYLHRMKADLQDKNPPSATGVNTR
jgi:hypothetical protein